jgi:hypothetical protein
LEKFTRGRRILNVFYRKKGQERQKEKGQEGKKIES